MSTLADKLILLLAVIVITASFQVFWDSGAAGQRVQIYQGDSLFQEVDLAAAMSIKVPGRMGDSTIQIEHGKARFHDSPCQNKFCVHSGWLTHAGEIAACLPNRISVIIAGQNTLLDGIAF